MSHVYGWRINILRDSKYQLTIRGTIKTYSWEEAFGAALSAAGQQLYKHGAYLYRIEIIGEDQGGVPSYEIEMRMTKTGASA